MTHSVATSLPKVFLDAYDISGHANAHTIGQAQDLPDDTNYGDSWRQRELGMRTMNFSVAGNIDLAGATDSDTIIQSKMAVADVPLIICNVGDAVGLSNPAEFGLVLQGQYNPQAAIGDMLKYSLTGEIANRRWIRGAVLWSSATSITGTANGTAVELGAVAAGSNIYAAISVIAEDLTTMTVKLQSSSDEPFTSPNDRITFTAVTGITADMPAPVAGSITDTFWRIIISAFTGTSAQLVGVAGIGAP
jgi:hypothetical protein